MKKLLSIMVIVAFLGGMAVAQNPPVVKEKVKTETKAGKKKHKAGKTKTKGSAKAEKVTQKPVEKAQK